MECTPERLQTKNKNRRFENVNEKYSRKEGGGREGGETERGKKKRLRKIRNAKKERNKTGSKKRNNEGRAGRVQNETERRKLRS